ncbi:murein DD-endopeptidase MepM/ murein hydrolase activator NlpD [Glaciihabitans tibetensis]|uniref:Murein DD-endopeptidase MepM/ murein hydrolase activator NlpD n=1 Tax=Glaciihabitans tibetensis TaxID=1266600 RepID=A0A2T0VA26_9MICO|nr:M23 family metallopeptidase [Glaciihabitans tibetensis]PRY67049.1 murein DD-endopeptidase MepM/ murein hydrolase activator NlpD [Glaciihabitans tibetensis]
MTDIEQAPLTRRELRERERAAEAKRTPRSSPTPHTVLGSQSVPVAATVAPDAILPEGVLPVVDLPTVSAPTIPSASASASPSASATALSGSAAATSSAETSAPSRRSAASVRVRKVRAAKSATAPSATRVGAPSRLRAFGALLFAGAMVVAVTIPAAAFIVDAPTAVVADDLPSTGEGQVVVADSANLTEVVEYDSWDVASPAELKQASAIRGDSSYTVSNEGAIRWPFPIAVPISDGYGTRVSPCSGCSTQHKGTDFTPGSGAPITAIADGVVSLKTTSSWGFGYHVYIDHIIDGQKVTSVYAHMQLGSSDLEVGDVVTAGDFIGLVGQTGAATGPHLHLEIRVDGVQVDPFLWLTVNAS